MVIIMVTISSDQKWNDTGVDFIEGRSYSYQATGQWKDWYIPSDANGFSCLVMDLFSWTKRTPSAKWFQLIGVIDKNPSHTIELAKEGTFTAPVSGRLWAYANDADFAYGNNSGSLELHIHQK